MSCSFFSIKIAMRKGRLPGRWRVRAMKTILVTGGTGQLGQALRQQAAAYRDLQFVFAGSVQADITKWSEVKQLVYMVKPDAIINCAAYTNVDAAQADEDGAFLVNTAGAGYLSMAAYEIGIPIVYPSTDYVFDGRGINNDNGNIRPYREYDPTNPCTVYGRTKMMGEQLTARHNPRHYIIRTAWLYGKGNNFVRKILKASRQDTVRVVADQTGSPTSAMELAKAILALLKSGQYGLYHCVCEGSCSRYELACEIYCQLGIRTKVIPVTTEEYPTAVVRPRYSVLDNYMLRLTTSIRCSHWRDALAEYLASNKVW
jgi:dTDP-4-dehydrorhamnose reductase